jgi:hypothetical protein
MKRIALAVALAAGAVAVPAAQAHNDGSAHGHSGNQHGAKSHKCRAHRVGFVVRGTVVSQTLARNDDGTYSGDVVVQVTRANHHARAQSGDPQPHTYTLDHAKARFHVSDQQAADGTVDQSDVVAGDRVELAGKVTKLHKRCDQTGFIAAVTIRRVVFHDPRPAPAARQ